MIQFADLFKECMSQFRETPEFSILSKHHTGGDCLSAQDRQAIIDCVERTFAPMFDQIRTDASSLTDTDLVFCVLSNIGVGATTIADCLTISPRTVRVRKHRMRDKLPASWYDFFYGEGADYDAAEEADYEAAEGADEAVAEDKPKLPFVGQISYCFRNYFNTKGRAGRSEYFCFFFFTALVLFGVLHLETLLYVISFNVTGDAFDDPVFVLLHVISWIIMVGVMIPMMTVTARRLHDLNCSGWLALLFCGLPCAILLADVALGAIYCEMFFGRIVASNEFVQYVLIPISIGHKVLWVMFFLQILVFSFRGSR